MFIINFTSNHFGKKERVSSYNSMFEYSIDFTEHFHAYGNVKHHDKLYNKSWMKTSTEHVSKPFF